MANLKNKTSITSLVALALTIVGIIVYFVNIGSAGYFQRAAVPAAVTWFLLGAAALVVVVLLSVLKLTGIAGKCVEVVAGLLQIAAPASLAGAAILLVQARAQGIAFVLFSNQEVLAEVQTAANMSSVTCAIATIAILAVAAIVAIVAAFFSWKKAN